MYSPTQIDAAPKMTVQRMPKRSATRPMAMPPAPAPSQASALASDGTERPPPTSAAMDLRPTAVIQNAPNEMASRHNAMLATTQEDRVSIDGVTNGNPAARSSVNRSQGVCLTMDAMIP